MQLSPSRSASEHLTNGNNARSCALHDDDEMELTDFYAAGGSQSIDCEASPPPLQVKSNPICVRFIKSDVLNVASAAEGRLQVQLFRSALQHAIQWPERGAAGWSGRILAAPADHCAKRARAQPARFAAPVPCPSRRRWRRLAIALPHAWRLVELGSRCCCSGCLCCRHSRPCRFLGVRIRSTSIDSRRSPGFWQRVSEALVSSLD